MSPKTRCMIFTTALLIPFANNVSAASDQDSKPDNSRANTFQNGERGLTAEQHGNQAGDVELTRKIRQSLVKDKKLSTYAHNVKIITEGGQVVLKGPVKSQQEKEIIEGKAGQIAGTDRVRSELEVAQ